MIESGWMNISSQKRDGPVGKIPKHHLYTTESKSCLFLSGNCSFILDFSL